MPAGCMRVVCGLYASCYAAVCELHARSYASCMPGCMCLSCSPVVSIASTKGFVHTKSVSQGAAKKNLAPLRLWSSSPDGLPPERIPRDPALQINTRTVLPGPRRVRWCDLSTALRWARRHATPRRWRIARCWRRPPCSGRRRGGASWNWSRADPGRGSEGSRTCRFSLSPSARRGVATT